MPFAFWIGRLCEEFTCVPSVAYREWLHAPAGLLEDVIEARAYARAKEMTDAADTSEARKRLPQTPLFQLVKEIEFALVRGEIDGATSTD
ncbi:MAG TPA: hypothetical protein VNJ03_14945 [Vicinamibacterales bacterium]|nr:hypothetical protein [Vicinamibacterales bacterium]